MEIHEVKKIVRQFTNTAFANSFEEFANTIKNMHQDMEKFEDHYRNIHGLSGGCNLKERRFGNGYNCTTMDCEWRAYCAGKEVTYNSEYFEW